MPSLWIIDGYNFIRQSLRFSSLEIEDAEAGKAAALRWLGRFSEFTGEQVCVVFDAYSGLQRQRQESHGFGVRILASRGGYTADEEIIEMAQTRGEGAIVISSDQTILRAAIKAGASVLKSEEFEREVQKILDDPGDERRPAREGLKKGNPFRPPREKKKAYVLLKKYQR